jgi:YMGG-like Gly-zipper
MSCMHTPARVLRKIVFFALLGFGVIFLSGPVIALFSFIISAALVILFVFLPFMLLGLIVWLPLRAIFGGRGRARRDLFETGRLVGKAAFVVPLRTCGHVYARARCARVRMHERVHTVTTFLGSILLEMVSGALVGALLGAIIGLQMNALQVSIPVGAVIGSALGLVVGASRVRQPREALSSQLEP